MTPLLIGFALFVALAIAIVLAVHGYLVRAFYKAARSDREYLRQTIQDAERRHKPRRELRKQFVEVTRRELV